MALPSGAFDTNHALSYDRSLEPLFPIKAVLLTFLRWHLSELPADARVLLAGAGTGAEARFLAPIFPAWRFTLVDPSAAMLGVARDHATAEGFVERCAFHVGTVGSLPVAPFDGAASVLVSHFLAQSDQRQAYFDEIAARLVPGAPFFNADLCAELQDPGFPALMALWLRLVGMPEDRRGPFTAAFGSVLAAHGPAEVEAMIQRAGFALPLPCVQAGLIRGWTAIRR